MRGMPPPPPKGKKEVARVLINNADNGGQMPLIIYHDLTDARGVESDVDRFISQYQIEPEMYREELLQAAYNRLEQPSAAGGSRRASSSGGGFQPPRKTERMQEGSRFGDTFDEEEDEEDEDEDEGDVDAHDGEEEEDEEDSPKQSRRAGGTSAPRQGKSAASLPDPSGNDDNWADEDEEHDHLPPPPPPPAAKSVRDRGAKLGELKLRIPQSDSGDPKQVTFPYFERDDYGVLLAEAKTFVSKHAMAEKEVDRLVDEAAKGLQKKKERLQRQ